MNFMRVLIGIILILFLGVNSAFAYELVLPNEKKSVVNTNYAFFVGKAGKSEILTINDDRIYIAPNGAFAHTVKLKDGENRIVIKSNFNTQIYKFYKTRSSQSIKPELTEFQPKLYKVKKDNTPMRSTPIDYGMNRISHLFEGTNLLINGEKGSFYRVFLANNKDGWIDKNSVQESSDEICPKFVTMDSEAFKNATKQSIEFTEKLPYTIEENDKEIVFRVYNSIVSEDSVYTININKPDKYYYETDLQGGKYLIKVTQLPKTETQTLDGLTIAVDPGHGGTEKGAIGCLGDKEKDINLKIATELKDILSQMGANVIMTRECDGNISLDNRVKMAKENCADIFVSIHLNSIPDIEMNVHKNRGTSVYYYNPNSKKLAKSVENSVTERLGTRKDGVRTASFAVLRPTEYIGILVEVAYMTNPIDSVLYTKDEFPRETAEGIADGILKYVTSE